MFVLHSLIKLMFLELNIQYLMINSFWKQGRPRLSYIWIWSMLNMKSAGHEQSLLPLPNFLGRSKETLIAGYVTWEQAQI